MSFKTLKLISKDKKVLARTRISLPRKGNKKKKYKYPMDHKRQEANYKAPPQIDPEEIAKENDIDFNGTRVLDDNFFTKKAVILNEGGARSSKSYSIAQLLIYRFFAEKNKKFLICRKHMKSLKYSIYKMFIDILSKHELIQMINHNKTMLEFRYESNYMLMTSIDDPSKLQSTEFNYIYMEEAEEFEFEDYIILKTRLSALQDEGRVNQIFLSYNPKKRNGYINKAVKLEDDVEIIKSSYKDNEHLQASYSKLLESIKKFSPEFYRTFTQGEYSVEENQVYKHVKIVKEFPVTQFERTFYGLDFGFNCQTALVKVQEKDKVYYITELIYERQMTNSELINKLKELNIHPDDYIYCDSAEPARIKDINKHSGCWAKAANKDVMNGIDFIKGKEIYSLYSNVNFNNELDNYCYKKSKFGKLSEEPDSVDDHLMDAMRYAIYTDSINNIMPNIYFF